MRANSSVLVLRLVWQTSLATLPFCRRSATRAVLTEVTCPAQGAKVGRLAGEVCQLSMQSRLGQRVRQQGQQVSLLLSDRT